MASGTEAQGVDSLHPKARLLAVVRVDKQQSILCGQAGCGHSVYAAIHVIDEGGKLSALGSSCFEKRYGGSQPLGGPTYGDGKGRLLTAEERQLLVDNTAALLARFEQERLEDVSRARLLNPEPIVQPVPSREAQFVPAVLQTTTSLPWAWAATGRSMGYFRLRDGSSWVRLFHRDGRHILAPWPLFDGWEEALPGRFGSPDLDLGGICVVNVVDTVAYLRQQGVWDRVCGNLRELQAAGRL